MKTVLANGVFDIFHIGHLRYLEEARKMGDRLVVAVTQNDQVGKGPGKPIYDEQDRLAVIKGLRCVDEAFITPNALFALVKVKPSIFVKGEEYRDKMQQVHVDHCKANGIEIRFTNTEEVRPSDRLASR